MHVVVGGDGDVEAALSVYLKNLAKTLGFKEQTGIAEFAESLLITPKPTAKISIGDLHNFPPQTRCMNILCNVKSLYARKALQLGQLQRRPIWKQNLHPRNRLWNQ